MYIWIYEHLSGFFFFSSRRRHTRLQGDWSSDVCSSDLIDRLKVEGDEKVGAQIVRRALEEPIRQIVENAGLEGSVVVEKVKAETVATRGFDAETMDFVDMMQAGIIDPAKVERVALENAASIASLLLTTEALITDLPEERKDAPPMPHGDMY